MLINCLETRKKERLLSIYGECERALAMCSSITGTCARNYYHFYEFTAAGEESEKYAGAMYDFKNMVSNINEIEIILINIKTESLIQKLFSTTYNKIVDAVTNYKVGAIKTLTRYDSWRTTHMTCMSQLCDTTYTNYNFIPGSTKSIYDIFYTLKNEIRNKIAL